MEKLKPCPFCGSIPELKYWNDDSALSCRYECDTCGCSLLWEDTPQEAKPKWNERYLGVFRPGVLDLDEFYLDD